MNATELYVAEALALQGVKGVGEAAKAIAPLLSKQMATAAPAYARLPFEAEPSAFLAVMTRESR